ncbi:MAG: AAA family ATPase [Chlamydiota bacterium]
MANGSAGIRFVQRSAGRNVVQKVAYISRSCLHFEGNCALDPKTYDFSHQKAPAYSAIMLPEHVDENFFVSEVLWNAVERAETRKNSQVGIEMVLALPDDEEVTLEEKIEMLRSFTKEHFVDKNFGAEIAIHFPNAKAKESGNKEGLSGELIENGQGEFSLVVNQNGKRVVIKLAEEELKKFDISLSNWHAHLIITTRRFKEDGKGFEKHKPRELMPQIRNGVVVSGPNWFNLWSDHQNAYFKSKGRSLRVDPPNLIPQKHLGPVRMRGECSELLAVNKERAELNTELAKNPENILIAISKRQSIFTEEDVERYINKHTPKSHVEHVRENFWKLPDLIQLRDKATHKPLALFSTRETIEEEKKILRIAERVNQNRTHKISDPIVEKFSHGLNSEQKKAYSYILKGSGISVLHGYAGTGKSYVLKALDTVYWMSGVTVRALGADNGAAEALRAKGITDVQNIHQFLFKVNKYDKLTPEKREVWILDEAGKLGNELLLEFLKTAQKYNAKVILSGDSAQLAAIQRGGMFTALSKRFPSFKLVEIQRQKDKEDLEIVKALAKGNTDYALDRLTAKEAIKWSETKSQAIEALATDWAKENKPEQGECPPIEKTIIVTGTNAETRILNSLIRETRKDWGMIGDENVECHTGYGTFQVSKGDLVCFRGNDNKIGVLNGMRGSIVAASRNEIAVAISGSGKKTRIVNFNPAKYKSFHLGYATNANLSQGGTWEKTYFLHAPHLNKEMLYVGMSRHTQDCKYYIAKTEATCLAELKLQANRSGEKITTCEHTHTDEIEREKAQAAREQELSELKTGDAFKTKLKGHFLSLTDKVRGKLSERVQGVKDLQNNEELYSYKNRQIFKTSPSVDIAAISSKLSELGTQKPFLKEELLKEIDNEALDSFYDRFFSVSEKASNLRLAVEIEAKQKDVPPSELESFGEMIGAYQEKYTIGKVFVEGAAYQKLSITQEWGADVEKTFKKADEKFTDSFTPKDFFRKGEKTALNKAWENNYFDSRRILKYSKAEAMILEMREEDTKGFAEGRQIAFEGNWYAYASLLEREGKTTQEAIFGVSNLSEATESKLTLKGIDPLKNAVEGFLKATKPSTTLFKEGFKTEEQPLKESENSYRHCLNKIGVLRREIAWQAAAVGTTDFKSCKSYKDLEKEFVKREGYAISCLVQIESRYHFVEEVLEERFVSQIGYQTAHFERKFELSDFRAEESEKEFSAETVEAIKEYEEVSVLALQLKRACTVEALAQGKKLGESQDFELCVEAEKARQGVAANLLKKIEKEGQKHFEEEAQQEIFKATLGFEKQERIADYEEKNQACARLWKNKDSEEYKNADEERSNAATLLNGLLSEEEKQKIFSEKDSYFFEKACQKEVAEKPIFEPAAERFLNTQQELGIAQRKVEMEENEETKEKTIRAEYSRWYKEAGRLGKILGEERKAVSNGDVRKCAHFQQFNTACANRNRAAFEARNFFGKNLAPAYGEKATHFIQVQASKHEEIQDKLQEKQFVSDPREFGAFLARNTEQIVEKLFPEGAKSSSPKEWRFGEKGSLSVKKDGYFFDYETQEGGGLLKLVQKEMGTDTRGAINWVKDTLGGFPTATRVTRQEKTTLYASPEKEEKWVSLRPDPNVPAPGRRASKDGFAEVARHPYRDADGNLIYYSIRMEDKNGDKRVIPLSFGHREGEENKPFWRMKGYDFGHEKRSLYNLHQLKQHPNAPVVVVEGEKTADAAPKVLEQIGREDFVAVSWSGGARSVTKTDWSPLAGREKVLIWPDNDEAGKAAGKLVEKELFKVKIQKQDVYTVDSHVLHSKFPKGWDLADKWPQNLSKEEKREISWGFKISELQDRFEYLSAGRGKDFGERLALSDLSARFLESKREGYENESFIGKTNFGKEKFLMREAEELNRILKEEKFFEKKLGEDPHINASGDLQKDLARQCTFFKLGHNRDPQLSEILSMKAAIAEAGKTLCLSRNDTGAWECAKHRVLADVCERSLKTGAPSIPSSKDLESQMQREMAEIGKGQSREIEIHKQIEHQAEIGKGLGL